MKSHIVLVSLGLSIFYLWGCTPAGKSYWLAYEVDKTMAPASTYKGYYSSKSGSVQDPQIADCLKNKDHETKNEGDQDRKKCKDLHKDLVSKPPLTDLDQAQVFMFKQPNDSTDLNGLDCQIKQTKITRDVFPVFVQGPRNILEKPSVYRCDLHLRDAGGDESRLYHSAKP